MWPAAASEPVDAVAQVEAEPGGSEPVLRGGETPGVAAPAEPSREPVLPPEEEAALEAEVERRLAPERARLGRRGLEVRRAAIRADVLREWGRDREGGGG